MQLMKITTPSNRIIPPVFNCALTPTVLPGSDVQAQFVLGNKGSGKSSGMRGEGYTLLIEGRKTCISSVVRGGG